MCLAPCNKMPAYHNTSSADGAMGYWERHWVGDDWDMAAQVRRLLASNEPSPLRVAAAPEAGDPEQMQAQQIRLMALGTRTMALPFGRAALTLGVFSFSPVG